MANPCDPALAASPRSYFYGGDLYFKWKPPNVAQTYSSLQWTTEFFSADARGRRARPRAPATPSPSFRSRAVSGAGARFDVTGLPSGPSVPRRYGYAGSLTFTPSEFSRFRLYAQELGGPGVTSTTVGFLQAEYLDGRTRRAPVLTRSSSMRSPLKIVAFAVAVAAGLAPARAPRPSCGSSPPSRRSRIWQQVGGDRVDVQSLSHGYQDPHFVEASRRWCWRSTAATRWFYVGLELEVGWLPPLVQQSRNARIQRGQPGQHRRLVGDQGRGHPQRPGRSAARARRHPSRSATRTTGSRPRTRGHRAPDCRARYRAGRGGRRRPTRRALAAFEQRLTPRRRGG